MWKTGISLRGTRIFFPQGNVYFPKLFHSACGSEISSKLFHSFVFHIPQPLWKKFSVKKERKTSEQSEANP